MPRTDAIDTTAAALFHALATDAPNLHTRVLANVGLTNQQRSTQKLPDLTPTDWLWELLTNVALGQEIVNEHQRIQKDHQDAIETDVAARLNAMKTAL